MQATWPPRQPQWAAVDEVQRLGEEWRRACEWVRRPRGRDTPERVWTTHTPAHGHFCLLTHRSNKKYKAEATPLYMRWWTHIGSSPASCVGQRREHKLQHTRTCGAQGPPRPRPQQSPGPSHPGDLPAQQVVTPTTQWLHYHTSQTQISWVWVTPRQQVGEWVHTFAFH